MITEPRAHDPYVHLIRSVLTQPTSAIGYAAGCELRQLYPGSEVMQCHSCGFDLSGYVEAGHADAEPLASCGHHEMHTSLGTCREDESEPGVCVGEEGIRVRPTNAFLRVRWGDEEFDALNLSWVATMRRESVWFLVGKARPPLDAFYSAVSEWTATPHGEVLVFERGSWRKDRALFASIQEAKFDNLVLTPGLKEQLCDDITKFFQNRDLFARYGVPWKRGVLLVGPPGNGKTHAVKALCRCQGVPVLYLRSLESARMFNDGEHANIARVFDLARRTAPCLLVLEDLDALIKPSNRSVFLNELDGFALNTGVCVVATTNYPERLDPSILERPSRFDRKYTFDLPGSAERRVYLEQWNRDQNKDLQLSPSGLQALSDATEAFSFAYLKELCLASTMAWMNAGTVACMDTVALDQAQALRTQLRSAATADLPAPSEPTRAEQIRAFFGDCP